MIVTLLDTVTGETRDYLNDHSLFDWCENNWSCDCNRCIPFGLDEDDLGKKEGYCFGEERFIVTKVVDSPDKSYTLREFNEGYPIELLEKYGVNPDEIVR